ncbi:MAG: S9 family peptidase [Rhodocyclaceae bacterium]|nr:S9 family peptidase [Rhodocyclaceae bacterium]MBP6279637.1 S9 family peptidase [Rhodocyclaceae bacterium]
MNKALISLVAVVFTGMFVMPLFAADTASTGDPSAAIAEDPYLWLEDVQGEKSLTWARERNAVSQAVLETVPVFADMRARLLAVLNSRDQIPYVSRRGELFYNFWRDAANPRGLWRRTTLAEYRKPEPKWEVVLDLDALAKSENENWVWGGSSCLSPKNERCLIWFSRGGADATVVREFDMTTRSFVKDGFFLPEAKSGFDWVDINTLYVGTDFGPGSMTKSGYPRVVKAWKRGTPLSEARVVFEGQDSDVSVQTDVYRTPGFERVIINRATDFFHRERYLMRAGDPTSAITKLDLPTDAVVLLRREWLFVQTKSDYVADKKSYPAGALLAIRFDDFLKGGRKFDLLFEPTATISLARDGVSFTRDHVLLNILDQVAGGLIEVSLVDGQWISRRAKVPALGKLSASGLYNDFARDAKHDPYANSYLLRYEDFVTPHSFYLGAVGSGNRELLKSRKHIFDAEGMRVEQDFATSKDGARIPYFVVWPKGAKADGVNPTLLYGYGGFQISQAPFYSSTYGSGWYRQGGVLVVANIRGGGEFGPNWHQAAMKANKQRSYDDFAAVAEAVIAKKITSPGHLGIYGGSNGGLLVGAVMLQRPELFGAVVCSVPLLDMKRYHTLLAGNSWMAEYGDPDKAEEWAWISKYSPYQNVKQGVKYPKVLFTTSTRDDRVHPGHARKMAAKMLDQGHEVLYYENIEGGHSGAANNAQRAYLFALENAFLWKNLGGK